MENEVDCSILLNSRVWQLHLNDARVSCITFPIGFSILNNMDAYKKNVAVVWK